jgi:hypothetical protein
MTEDQLARDDHVWTLIGHSQRLSFAEAARLALDAERDDHRITGAWGAVERARARFKSWH